MLVLVMPLPSRSGNHGFGCHAPALMWLDMHVLPVHGCFLEGFADATSLINYFFVWCMFANVSLTSCLSFMLGCRVSACHCWFVSKCFHVRVAGTHLFQVHVQPKEKLRSCVHVASCGDMADCVYLHASALIGL